MSAQPHIWMSSPQRVEILVDDVAVCLSEAAFQAVKASAGNANLDTFARASVENGRTVWRPRVAGGGELRPLSRLSGPERDAFAQAVREPFARLAALVNNPAVGHIAAALLT